MPRASRKKLDDPELHKLQTKPWSYAPRNCVPHRNFGYRFVDLTRRAKEADTTPEAFQAQLELDLKEAHGRVSRPRDWPRASVLREIERRGERELEEPAPVAGRGRNEALDFVYLSMGGEVLVANLSGLTETEAHDCYRVSLSYGKVKGYYKDVRRVVWPSQSTEVVVRIDHKGEE